MTLVCRKSRALTDVHMNLYLSQRYRQFRILFYALFLPLQQNVLRMRYITQQPNLYKIYRWLIVRQFCLKTAIFRGLVLSGWHLHPSFFETLRGIHYPNLNGSNYVKIVYHLCGIGCLHWRIPPQCRCPDCRNGKGTF